MEKKNYELNDRVKMKKIHPCGSYHWYIKRLGADIKIKCQGCGRLVMLKRSDFEKMMRGVENEN